MAQFNSKTTKAQRLEKREDKSLSHERGRLFKNTAETELYLQVCTMLFGDKYYEKGSQAQTRMRNLINKCDRHFVLQLAAFARQEMKMRSAPLMLLAEASHMESAKGESKRDVRLYTPKIVKRADEPMEVLAYWLNNIGNGNKRNLPNALKKGLADTLHNFNEYHFAKYNRAGDVKLKDVVQLVHPKPQSKEQANLFKRILSDDLKTPDTWETKLSKAGQVGQSKKEAWNQIIHKMGIMAVIRNLRNMEQAGAKDALKIARQKMRNPEIVQRSRMLPYRWYMAYKNGATTSATRDALIDGLELSLANLPQISGNIAVVSDSSGSMSNRLSDKSNMTYLEVGALMSAMAVHLIKPGSEYTIGHFGNKYEEIPVSRRDSVITNMKKVLDRSGRVGHGTNASSILDTWIRQKKVVDHFFLFSDMQIMNRTSSWGSYYGSSNDSFAAKWEEYRRKVNPKAILYSFDLAGYGKGGLVPEPEKGTYQLAGFSEKVFDFMKAVEECGTAVQAIKNAW